MHKIRIGWMYPNLFNLHGERGSVQALVQIGKKMGLDVEILRFDDLSQPIPFSELDMLIFLPGEITQIAHTLPILESQKAALTSYLESGGHLLAIGTAGLMFGRSILREDNTHIECLGYLDMTAKERKYVWGDDLHIRILGNKQELVGSQIMMADVETTMPLAQTIYGRGNNGHGTDGARWNNLIYTNCLGPLFVKNPWFAETILKDICMRKFLKLSAPATYSIASNSFHSTLDFINTKQSL